MPTNIHEYPMQTSLRQTIDDMSSAAFAVLVVSFDRNFQKKRKHLGIHGD